MALTPGTRIGVYEVTAQIGVGGMGEVYRATDSNLKRSVAIKVLPAEVAGDTDRLARFQREAEVLAALNHPNIAAIYGLEKTPNFTALVMELVEGDDLSQRIARGAIPFDEALPIAKQIADALEAAHEQGIIHRDLKPANIKVRSDGTVKVLDFGLAKAMEPAAGSSPSMSMSPTITTPAMTQVGMILGTAAYMSPEQAKGRGLDKRSDVWAFGCVFFEMLTGRRAFDGEDVTDTIAAVVRGEPDWTALPADVPDQIRLLLKRCLEKERNARISDVGIIRFLLMETMPAPAAAATPAAAGPRPLWKRAIPVAVASMVTAAIVGSAVWVLTRPAPAAPPVVHLQAPPNPGVSLWIDTIASDIALSPDGTHLAYTGGTGQSELYVRSLSQDDAVPLAGTANIRGPFFSPDGEWIGYFQLTDLKKVSVRGGPPVTICTNCGPGNRGAAWAADDTIIFAAQGGRSGLLRVSAGGGQPAVIVKPDNQKGEQVYAWPHLLPGGRAVLFTVFSNGTVDDGIIAVRDLQTGTQKILVHGGTFPLFVRSGYVVYATAGTLRAIRFDPTTLTVSGNPLPVLDHVASKGTGAADVGVSRDGAMAYISGVQGVLDLASVDRQGHEDRLSLPPRPYLSLRFSPDGQRIALDIRDQENDIWIWDVSRRTLTRLTTGSFIDQDPVWTPDGRRIAFSSTHMGATNLYWQAADGTGDVERLTTSGNGQVPLTFTPDGKSLIFRELDGVTGFAVLNVLPLEGDRTPKPLMRTPVNAVQAALSPDGHWLAYQSTESGQDEIHVRPFPDVESGHWQISTDGGTRPVWAPSGHELFYLDTRFRLMTVPLQPKPFAIGTPSAAFQFGFQPPAGLARFFDVTPDGKHFLAIRNVAQKDEAAQPNQVKIILNWDEELKRLAPAKR